MCLNVPELFAPFLCFSLVFNWVEFGLADFDYLLTSVMHVFFTIGFGLTILKTQRDENMGVTVLRSLFLVLSALALHCTEQNRTSDVNSQLEASLPKRCCISKTIFAGKVV